MKLVLDILQGLGLVYGLKGTGDGGDYLAAIRPLSILMGKFADPVTVQELNKTGNVAVVLLKRFGEYDPARSFTANILSRYHLCAKNGALTAARPEKLIR